MLKKKTMKNINVTATVLTAVGGINWGLIGIANFNLVEALAGTGMVSRVVYSLVGVASVYTLSRVFMK